MNNLPQTPDATETRRLDHATFHELAVEILDRQQGIVFRAHGRSMWPFIRDADTLHVESVPSAQLRIGDIVLFRAAGGALLVHRIVRRRQGESGASWVTRGDALFAADAPFAAGQLLGRVACRIRRRRAVRLDRGWRRWAGLCWVRTMRLRAVLRRLRTVTVTGGGRRSDGGG